MIDLANKPLHMLGTAGPDALLKIQKSFFYIARNTISYEILKNLIKHPNADIRLATMSNDLMDSSLLAELAKDEDHFIRYTVAINLLTSPIDLIRLSSDNNALVRKGVYENINYYTKVKNNMQMTL